MARKVGRAIGSKQPSYHHCTAMGMDIRGGVSMCVLLDGRSIEAIRRFGGIFELPVATRSGNVPPGPLFCLLHSKQFHNTSLEKMLHERAGLLGLSATSGDRRVLEERTVACAIARRSLANSAPLGWRDWQSVRFGDAVHSIVGTHRSIVSACGHRSQRRGAPAAFLACFTATSSIFP